MKSLLFWIAFPFLLPQALYVRKNAPRFAPAAGPKTGAMGEGNQIRLLAIGDSIIAGVGATELGKALVGQTATALAESKGCRVAWQALGISGYTSTKILERLMPKLPELSADYIIVSVGVNDITGLTTMRQWRRNLSLLLEQLQVHSPEAFVAIAGMPPMHGFPLLPQPLRAVFGMRARSFDEAAKTVICGHLKAIHVPLDFDPDAEKFSADGYHPSEASYVEFGRQMADSLVAREAHSV